jgi:hypothetical protein
MRRAKGALIGAAAAVAAGGVVVLLSARLGAERARADGSYEAAMAGARRAAAAERSPAPAPRATTVQVRGAEGLAAAAAQGAKVCGKDGRLDRAALVKVSREAFAAARDAEDATGTPALPQRMGLAVTAPSR